MDGRSQHGSSRTNEKASPGISQKGVKGRAVRMPTAMWSPIPTGDERRTRKHRAGNRPAPSTFDDFVDRSEIDPRYLIRSYYPRPDGKVGHDAFAVNDELIGVRLWKDPLSADGAGHGLGQPWTNELTVVAKAMWVMEGRGDDDAVPKQEGPEMQVVDLRELVEGIGEYALIFSPRLASLGEGFAEVWRILVRRSDGAGDAPIWRQDFVSVVKVQAADDLPQHTFNTVGINHLGDAIRRQVNAFHHVLEFLHHLIDQRYVDAGLILLKDVAVRCVSALASTGQGQQRVEEIFFIELPREVTGFVHPYR
jgi:hypothetical protein